MKKPKNLKNPVDSITKATLLLLTEQIKLQYVPDYSIAEICRVTGLVDKEARKIRDIIQKDFELLWIGKNYEIL